MQFNNSTNGDPRSFFYYKNDFYINRTEIALKTEYINTHLWNGKKLWKYARYDHQVSYNGQISYFFCASKFDWPSLNSMGLERTARDDYAPYFLIPAVELENAIEEIIKPIKLERKETDAILENITKPKNDLEEPGLIVLWLIYIAVLVGSLIFKQFYIIWLIATMLFVKWRKEIKK